MHVDSNGVRIHVEDQGTGAPALVFLHYWGGSSRTWNAVVDALPITCRIVRPDLRGWGSSVTMPSSDGPVGYNLSDYAADVAAVVSALELDNYVLIGHSMGGKIAQLLASQRPSGLAGLVLVAPAPPGALQMPEEAKAAMASAYVSEASVGLAIEHMLTSRPLSPEQRRQVIEDSLRGTAEAKIAWPQSISQEDITHQVQAINVPTVVIAGERDQVDSVATLKAHLLPNIPHADFHELAGTGHLSPLESPVELAAIIGGFVSTLRSKLSA
ncbi:alpha/beta hydrolase [Pseudomonas abietaniphila]|uniref:alpha/beta fold hydrolase n=1 Tax=Pseudomonas abietaniphila TaxID=89065 RepID=UPI0032162547